MYIPFEDLPEHSKIWIYQANRKLSDEEVTEITEATKEFVEKVQKEYESTIIDLGGGFLVIYYE